MDTNIDKLLSDFVGLLCEKPLRDQSKSDAQYLTDLERWHGRVEQRIRLAVHRPKPIEDYEALLANLPRRHKVKTEDPYHDNDIISGDYSIVMELGWHSMAGGEILEPYAKDLKVMNDERGEEVSLTPDQKTKLMLLINQRIYEQDN